MIADEFVLGCSEDLIRIIVPQITLEHKREFMYIRKFTDVIRVDFLLFHTVMVKRRETVQSLHQTLEQFVLHCLEIFFGHCLDSRIPTLHQIASHLSITRFAFPSKRGNDPGSTSLTVVRSSRVSRSYFPTFFWIFARSVSSPLKKSLLISTSTVISSR